MRACRLERGIRGALWAIIANLITGTAVLAQSEARPWASVTEQRLLNPDDGDWMHYRRTYDAKGFSPLDEINRTNVDGLRLVWAYSMRDNSRWVPTPVVANGIMYVAEGSGRVVALDVLTGDLVWSYERSYPEGITSYQRARAVTLFQDRLYWGTPDSYLVSLDARTGNVIWEVRTGDPLVGHGHTHPPLLADGKILLGNAGGDRLDGVRGALRAFDPETGDLIWTFYTVPGGPGEPGWDTWPQRNQLPPLGGLVWHTISYDPELRMVYFGTGQPFPWSSTLRGSGDVLYTNSIVALDVGTGEMKWHQQLVPEDNWDMDTPHESILVDLLMNGVTRRALVQTSKIGWAVVLDRETGEFFHAFRIAHDNIITGWTEMGSPIFNPEVIPVPEDADSDKVFEVCPHLFGARNLNSASYSPITGLYYLGVNNTCMDVSFITEEYEPGRPYRGMRSTSKMVPGYDYIGEFVAFDPVRGERAWVYRPDDGSAMTAAALTTAGGIVFGGNSNREFFALDSGTGELLWRTRLNGDISGAPMTFAIDGKQYLAVGAGGRIGQTTGYARLTQTDIPQGTGVLWLFALP